MVVASSNMNQLKTDELDRAAQAPPTREDTPLTLDELTAELTRRLAQPNGNRKIVYDQPCDNGTNLAACVDPLCQHHLSSNPRETVKKITQSSDLTLDPHQRRAILSLGNAIPDSDVIVASAVSSNHFDEMQAMFESLHKTVYPLLEQRIEDTKRDLKLLQQQNKVGIQNYTVALFDIGLTPEQRRLAASHRARKLVVWQDASVRWFSSGFLDSLDTAYSSGHQLLRYLDSDRIPAVTVSEMFEYMGETSCSYLPYPELQANLHIHRTDDKFNRQMLFEPWARCALEEKCMCPRPPITMLVWGYGSPGNCHRFDQSAFSILLSRIYQEKLYKVMFQEFAFSQEKGFRVSRGHKNKYYFKP
ncbi:hypothetical protein ElyMa_000747400 [Elysia marginata]|uniref:Uncharacterized protein n=1 Tax=Elysia marginata TaxID=1093978 RepID=A0AAV4GNX1_9GAST|nr:hypothetical protein ElyMa_000747400 [Elysia marginata]